MELETKIKLIQSEISRETHSLAIAIELIDRDNDWCPYRQEADWRQGSINGLEKEILELLEADCTN